ncbi:MAG TPA: penicillin-binding protein 2 [Solirubrobacterales bacterium]|nr:penicillin-binding protein 2 [Solirubrobacterales bacterium]
MNVPIRRLLAVALVLFALLVGFTSQWSVFDAAELEAKVDNKRPLFEAQQIKRGKITAADGQVIANSRKEGDDESFQYVRQYPTGSLFAHPIGYSFITQGTSGFERAENATLTGEENEFVSIIDQIRGQRREGSDIVTTLDASAQQLATDQLQATGRPGAVVAIEPSTGAVKVMASTPSFDPNRVPEDLDEFNDADPSVLTNRAIQELYPPGSTFKVVTAAAALDSGAATPDTVLSGASPQTFSGVPLSNAGGEPFGDIDMRTALTHSVNTYFAQLGEMVGTETLLEYMDRFGFGKDPEVQLPDEQKAASGVFVIDDKRGGFKQVDEGFDLARVAIGQGGEEGEVRASVTQMAEVAATVANGGELMKPTLIEKVIDPDGRVTDELDPEVQSEVMSDETAAALAEMMTSVTVEGTAAGLSVPGAESFAGKTGTAEINIEQDIAQPWFIAFAPVEDPQIAVAVTTDPCAGCFGGEVAGPIATAVMSEILGG